MVHENKISNHPLERGGLMKKMLLGAAVALILIVLLLLQVKNPNAGWGRFWMVRPLVVVPIAGAAGGFCYMLIGRQFAHWGIGRALAVIAGLIVYTVGLWMGIVLGLDGTLWD